MRSLVRKEVAKAGSLGTWWSSLRPSFRHVNVQGVRARYLCNGSGPPLLLLCSPLGFARTYMRAMRSLCRSFTVVCVELPGSGGSDRLEHPWSVERYAEWVLELVRHLPLAAPIVVGHGAAVPIAQELAQIAPDEIGGLVLAEAPGAFNVRALPQIVLNALRHRTSFAVHVRTARAATPYAALGPASSASVPTVHAQRLEDDWRSIRRFVAAVRRGAHGMPSAGGRPAFAS